MKTSNGRNRIGRIGIVGLALALGAWGAGCATPKPKTTLPAKTLQEAKPTPAEDLPAKITLVNVQYHFVVLDFAKRPIPPLGTQLNVWRGQQKVGSVRVSEPVRSPRFATADILEGELHVGDEAR